MARHYEIGSSYYEEDWQSALVAKEDLSLLCPITYVYDYLPHDTQWLQPLPTSLDCVFSGSNRRPWLEVGPSTSERNAIQLYPQPANLPLHTGLENFKQSVHWKANVEATRELLELFAKGERCERTMISDHWRLSLARLAERLLKTTAAVENTYSRYSVYMFANADERRIKLLAQSVILIFMFDDVWEVASPSTIAGLREDLVSRLQGRDGVSSIDPALMQRISEIRLGLLAGDAEQGNGGSEVLQTLIDFCHHPPPEDFVSARAYLDYRWEDIGNSFTWACTKFSLRSSVDQESPKLQPILRHIGDHISISNDIASYDKEMHCFQNGNASSMINIVHVIEKIEGLDTTAAKSMAYAWQLCTENKIRRGLEDLRRLNELNVEEWIFLDGCLTAASGNTLTSVVISRYGGEGARITK